MKIIFLFKSNKDFWATLPNNKLAPYLLYLTYLYLSKQKNNNFFSNLIGISRPLYSLYRIYTYLNTKNTYNQNYPTPFPIFYIY